MTSPQEAIEQEFQSYYHSDELVVSWDQPERAQEEMESHAEASADGLRRTVGHSQLAALRELLDSARSDPHHPLIARLGRASNLDWTEAQTWPVLQHLLKRIAEHLAT
jgi:hypothetical protein